MNSDNQFDKLMELYQNKLIIIQNQNKQIESLKQNLNNITSDSGKSSASPTHNFHTPIYQTYQTYQTYQPYQTYQFQIDLQNCFNIPSTVLPRKIIDKNEYISLKKLQQALYLKYQINQKWLKNFLKNNSSFEVIRKKKITYVRLK